MKHLWRLVYWPALAVVVLCLIVNFISTFVHSLAQDAAEHAEQKLNAKKARP